MPEIPKRWASRVVAWLRRRGDPIVVNARPERDSFRGVVFILLGVCVLGAIGFAIAGLSFRFWTLVDVAMSLGLCGGILLGVAIAQSTRMEPPKDRDTAKPPAKTTEGSKQASPSGTPTSDKSEGFFESWSSIREVGVVTALIGALTNIPLFGVSLFEFRGAHPVLLVSAVAMALCLCAAGLAATTSRYMKQIEAANFPEALGICRGARVLFWLVVLAALSVGFTYARLWEVARDLHFIILTLNLALCAHLIFAKWPEAHAPQVFPLDFGLLSILGSRPNVFASVLDSAERGLGINLRSTWALTVVRRTIEPMILGLGLVGWLLTSLTVVGPQEAGVVERLGVVVGGEPLSPGLHLHWPWPIDEVSRVAVKKVQAVEVGHEGEEGGGPENVLWAVEHAPNEYTLLLGNGRDLITVDATVQFRITDVKAWKYQSQNPFEALRAIAYRSVMESTVNRTLSEALSENLTTLTGQMREMVQKDAKDLDLGVEILAFTVGGMHPPVPVASDYEAVVSAQVGRVTSVVNARAYRNQSVPAAEASVITQENQARAEGAQSLAVAAGEAWSFRTLESQYRAAPKEYVFRRRLETLEGGLQGRRFTVLDSRFQRDGGELWLIR